MASSSGYVNPIGKGLTPERIDQGVDYGGAGPLYALGAGTVTNLYNSGWPGGTFLTIHLNTGQYIYYAENITPLVSVGQQVTAGQHIANATGGPDGIEVGWASPPGNGGTMAQVYSQESPTGDPGSRSSAFGQLMSELIASLGGPPGILQGSSAYGTIPSDFGITVSGKTITTSQQQSTSSASGGSVTSASSLPGIFSWPGEITGFFSDAKTFVDALLWIVNPASWLRIGSFFVALILLAFAMYVFTRVGSDEPLFQMPTITPVPV